MHSIQDFLFGPLSPQYCNWFYILMVISLISTFVGALGALGHIATAKKIDNAEMGTMAALLFNGVLAYFVNRLMYNMCIQSIGVRY